MAYFHQTNSPEHSAHNSTRSVGCLSRLLLLSALLPQSLCTLPYRSSPRDYCPEAAQSEGLRNSSGNFAKFAAIRRASSLLSSLAVDRRPGSFS
jgi:hypothetical protein